MRKMTAEQVWAKLSDEQKEFFHKINEIKEQAKTETDPAKKEYLEAMAGAMATSMAKELGHQFPDK